MRKPDQSQRYEDADKRGQGAARAMTDKPDTELTVEEWMGLLDRANVSLLIGTAAMPLIRRIQAASAARQRKADTRRIAEKFGTVYSSEIAAAPLWTEET